MAIKDANLERENFIIYKSKKVQVLQLAKVERHAQIAGVKLWYSLQMLVHY